jgi:hypothetical protein
VIKKTNLIALREESGSFLGCGSALWQFPCTESMTINKWRPCIFKLDYFACTYVQGCIKAASEWWGSAPWPRHSFLLFTVIFAFGGNGPVIFAHGLFEGKLIQIKTAIRSNCNSLKLCLCYVNRKTDEPNPVPGWNAFVMWTEQQMNQIRSLAGTRGVAWCIAVHVWLTSMLGVSCID